MATDRVRVNRPLNLKVGPGAVAVAEVARLDGPGAHLFGVGDYRWGIVAGSGVWFELTDPGERAKAGDG
jgi:hypothetical protein